MEQKKEKEKAKEGERTEDEGALAHQTRRKAPFFYSFFKLKMIFFVCFILLFFLLMYIKTTKDAT